MTVPDPTNANTNERRFLQLAGLCEEQLLACKNGDIDRIGQLLARKERLLAGIDFAQLDPASQKLRQAALRMMQCDSESAEALQTHHAKLAEALERLRNGRTARRGYGPPLSGSVPPQLLDRHE
jgi:hypothetical protein